MDDKSNADESLTEDDYSEDTRQTKKGRQGFASMSEEKQRSIASKGGRAAHAQGTAHEWDSKEAKEAGRKGGRSRGSNIIEEAEEIF